MTVILLGVWKSHDGTGRALFGQKYDIHEHVHVKSDLRLPRSERSTFFFLFHIRRPGVPNYQGTLHWGYLGGVPSSKSYPLYHAWAKLTAAVNGTIQSRSSWPVTVAIQDLLGIRGPWHLGRSPVMRQGTRSAVPDTAPRACRIDGWIG